MAYAARAVGSRSDRISLRWGKPSTSKPSAEGAVAGWRRVTGELRLNRIRATAKGL